MMLPIDVVTENGIAVEVVHDDTDLSDFYFLIGANSAAVSLFCPLNNGTASAC